MPDARNENDITRDGEATERNDKGVTPDYSSDTLADYDAPPATEPATPVEALAAVHDDPDEPENPDDKTRAGTEAARASLAPRGVHRRKYRGPRSILMLLFVLGLIIAVGAWATSWALRYVETNQKIELSRLEERDQMSTAQQRLMQLKNLGPNVAPAGFVYQPLTPQEKATMIALKQRFGPQFKPNDRQQGLLVELKMYEEARGVGAASQPVK